MFSFNVCEKKNELKKILEIETKGLCNPSIEWNT